MGVDAVHIPPLAVPVGWTCAPLDDLVDQERGISYGVVQPGEHDPSGLPVIRVNNLRNGRISTDDVLRIGPDIEANHRRTRLRGDEVLLSVVGTLGECAVVPRELAGWNVARAVAVIPLKADVDPRWVATCLRSASVQDLMRAWATTTVQATLNLRDVRRLPILLAPALDRREIARAITQVEDKIEQNRRTARVMERLARAIFRAWFVDFEPVRAKAEGAGGFPGMPRAAFKALPDALADSGIGPIPHSWRVGEVADIAREVRNGVVPSEIDPSTPYIGLEHMPLRSVALAEWENASKVTSNKSRFRSGDVLFGKLRPYFHKVGVAPTDGVCSTDIVVVEPATRAHFGMVLCLLSSAEFVAYANARSTGTKMPRTKWADMRCYPLAIPPAELVDGFAGIVHPLIQLITAGIHESRKLAELRDYLLPKLLSGAVRVRPDSEGVA